METTKPEVTQIKKPTFFGRIFKSKLFNGVLAALPFGKVLTEIKETVSSQPEHQGKNYVYLASYILTAALIWLFIIGKIDQDKLEYLFSFILKIFSL